MKLKVTNNLINREYNRYGSNILFISNIEIYCLINFNLLILFF